MSGIEGAPDVDGQCDFEGLCGLVHESPGSLQNGERRMSFIQVANFRLDSQLRRQQGQDDSVFVRRPDAAIQTDERRSRAFLFAKTKRAVKQPINKPPEADRHFVKLSAQLRSDAINHLDALKRLSRSRLLCSQLLQRAQKRDDVFAAQHSVHVTISHHRQLIDSVAVHFLKRSPQLRIRGDSL
jgi:hypothetical protein